MEVLKLMRMADSQYSLLRPRLAYWGFRSFITVSYCIIERLKLNL
jgi:hypothetical protein